MLIITSRDPEPPGLDYLKAAGEELGPACVGTAMQENDTFTTHHRGHGIFVARGGDPNRMLAEIAGKKDGYCKGKGGSMHIADMKYCWKTWSSSGWGSYC